MEENKKSQDVKKSTLNNENKMSYEELNNVCAQLYQQNQNLIKQVQQLNVSAMFKRLDYLFKIVEFNKVFEDKEFVASCLAEIKEAMTVVNNDDNKESPEEK